MIINKLEAQELIKFFSNQFVDRNSTTLYDGEVVNQFLSRLQVWLSTQYETCDVRYPVALDHKNKFDGPFICTLKKDHDSPHMCYVNGTLIKQWQK